MRIHRIFCNMVMVMFLFFSLLHHKGISLKREKYCTQLYLRCLAFFTSFSSLFICYCFCQKITDWLKKSWKNSGPINVFRIKGSYSQKEFFHSYPYSKSNEIFYILWPQWIKLKTDKQIVLIIFSVIIIINDLYF